MQAQGYQPPPVQMSLQPQPGNTQIQHIQRPSGPTVSTNLQAGKTLKVVSLCAASAGLVSSIIVMAARLWRHKVFTGEDPPNVFEYIEDLEEVRSKLNEFQLENYQIKKDGSFWSHNEMLTRYRVMAAFSVIGFVCFGGGILATLVPSFVNSLPERTLQMVAIGLLVCAAGSNMIFFSIFEDEFRTLNSFAAQLVEWGEAPIFAVIAFILGVGAAGTAGAALRM